MKIRVFEQSQPYADNWGAALAGPKYFSETVYRLAAGVLGADVAVHSPGFAAAGVLATLRLSWRARNAIKNKPHELAIIWQGYGVYAALTRGLSQHGVPFILNSYKLPGALATFRGRVSDLFLAKAMKSARGVVMICRGQADIVGSYYNRNVLWLPFASDSTWWTPRAADRVLLKAAGVGEPDYILVMGDVNRDEHATLRGLGNLNHPIVRVTRSRETAAAATEVLAAGKIKDGLVLTNVSFAVLRELYRGARLVVVPAISKVHPAGMTSMTEAMSCARPVLIPSGQTTDGYVRHGYDAFVLEKWNESDVRDVAKRILETDAGEVVGTNARRTVDERLNFDASAVQIARFIGTTWND